MVGGVLVEKTLDEVNKNLNDNITMLDHSCKALENTMGNKQKEIVEFETKYNVNPNKRQEKGKEGGEGEKGEKGPGLLV